MQAGVTLDIKSGIASVQFYHPKANSFPLKQLVDLENALIKARESEVIVLSSVGEGAFCAGASFEELQCLDTMEDATNFFLGFGRVMRAMIESPSPVICRVQGKAVGGALGLIAASDYVFATPEASVKLSELDIGIGPFVISPFLRFKMGHAAFFQMSLDRLWYSSEWAEQRGLYSQVTDQLDSKVLAFANSLKNTRACELKTLFWSDFSCNDAQMQGLAQTSARLWLEKKKRES